MKRQQRKMEEDLPIILPVEGGSDLEEMPTYNVVTGFTKKLTQRLLGGKKHHRHGRERPIGRRHRRRLQDDLENPQDDPKPKPQPKGAPLDPPTPDDLLAKPDPDQTAELDAKPKPEPKAPPKGAPLSNDREGPLVDPKPEPKALPKGAPLSNDEAPLVDPKPKPEPNAPPKDAPLSNDEAPLVDPKPEPKAPPKGAPLSNEREGPLVDPKPEPKAPPKGAPLSNEREGPLVDPKPKPVPSIDPIFVSNPNLVQAQYTLVSSRVSSEEVDEALWALENVQSQCAADYASFCGTTTNAEYPYVSSSGRYMGRRHLRSTMAMFYSHSESGSDSDSDSDSDGEQERVSHGESRRGPCMRRHGAPEVEDGRAAAPVTYLGYGSSGDLCLYSHYDNLSDGCKNALQNVESLHYRFEDDSTNHHSFVHGMIFALLIVIVVRLFRRFCCPKHRQFRENVATTITALHANPELKAKVESVSGVAVPTLPPCANNKCRGKMFVKTIFIVISAVLLFHLTGFITACIVNGTSLVTLDENGESGVVDSLKVLAVFLTVLFLELAMIRVGVLAVQRCVARPDAPPSNGAGGRIHQLFLYPTQKLLAAMRTQAIPTGYTPLSTDEEATTEMSAIPSAPLLVSEQYAQPVVQRVSIPVTVGGPSVIYAQSISNVSMI